MWTGVCHKCGAKIFNGIPAEEQNGEISFKRYAEIVANMGKQGYIIGYNTKPKINPNTNQWEDTPIEPICELCSNEISKRIQESRDMDNILLIAANAKKMYSCPIEDCKEQFYTKTDLKRHLFISHRSHELECIARDIEASNRGF